MKPLPWSRAAERRTDRGGAAVAGPDPSGPDPDGPVSPGTDPSDHVPPGLDPAESLPPREGPDASPRLPRFLAVLGAIAAAYLAMSFFKDLQDILGPTLLTLNLMIVVWPVTERLRRIGVPKAISLVVTGLLAFGILALFLATLAWSMVSLVRELPTYQDRFGTIYTQLQSFLTGLGISQDQINNGLNSISPSNVIGVVTGALTSLTSAFSLLLVTVTILFCLLIDAGGFTRRMVVARTMRPALASALGDFAHGVRRYWIVSSVFGLIVAVLDWGALMLMGVPLALVWGILSFLTNYIPNIGFILGIVPPTLMALLANGPTTALLVFVAYCVINFVIQSVIQPKFNGDAVGVTATIAMISLLFWAAVLGPLGALLSLPATLLAKTLLVDADPKARWVNAFIAADPDDAHTDTDTARKEIAEQHSLRSQKPGVPN